MAKYEDSRQIAHLVAKLNPSDGKFRFGSNERRVWGYIVRLEGGGALVKIDSEQTYLWPRDARIEQKVIEFLARDREAATANA